MENQPQPQSHSSKKIILSILLIIGIIALGFLINFKLTHSTLDALSVIEFNCTQSGGEFTNNECQCPELDGDLLAYDSSTGQCMTAFGIPGGKLGEEARQKQEALMQEPAYESKSDFISSAKESYDAFMYVVSSPNYEETELVLRDALISFALKYDYNDWGKMYFSDIDLSATDGANKYEIVAFVAYEFCTGNYYCDQREKKGKGFELTLWNAEYEGRTDNPDFYLENGETLVTESGALIITYKPYEGTGTEEAVKTLFESFEML